MIWFAYGLAIGAAVLTAIAQVVLKKGSSNNSSLLSVYANTYTISGYSLMFLVTLLNLYAYRIVPLKFYVVVIPFTTALVCLLSIKLLNDTLTRSQTIGLLSILLGIVLFHI
jgi:uncharacterized membrane protein